MAADKRGKIVLWALPANRLFEYLKSSASGLDQAEAEERLKKSGPNEIAAKERQGWLEILVSQFRNALVLLLAMAAVISFFIGEKIDALVILAIVLLNSALGFVQLPPGIMIFTAAIILTYFAFAEIAKKHFFSKFEA